MCLYIGQFCNQFSWVEETGNIRFRTPLLLFYNEAILDSSNLFNTGEAFEYKSTTIESYYKAPIVYKEEEDSLNTKGQDS